MVLILTLRNHTHKRVADNFIFGESNLRNHRHIHDELARVDEAVVISVEIGGVNLLDVASDDDLALIADTFKQGVGLNAALVLEFVVDGDFGSKVAAAGVSDSDGAEVVFPGEIDVIVEL